jgi:hypothetical protein
VLLVACWLVADLEVRTKLIFTAIYLATWALVFIDGLLVAVAQGALAGVLWWATFGPTGRR